MLTAINKMIMRLQLGKAMFKMTKIIKCPKMKIKSKSKKVRKIRMMGMLAATREVTEIVVAPKSIPFTNAKMMKRMETTRKLQMKKMDQIIELLVRGGIVVAVKSNSA